MNYNYRFFMKTLMAFCLFAINVFFSQSTTTSLNLDTSYNFGTGTFANGSVTKTFVQSDGKVILVGNFNLVGGASRSNIARLNTDGTVDTSFNPGTGFSQPYSITDIKTQTDGKIIIMGYFMSYNGTPRSTILRLNVDGSLDTSFSAGTGSPNTPIAMALQSDGKILVMGSGITTFNGSSVNNLFRLNTDGTLDSSFVAENFTVTLGYVSLSSIKVQSVNGVDKILVGGSFTSYGTTPRTNIVRLNLDGTVDSTFDTQGLVGGTISGIEITASGNLLLQGGSANYNGATRQGIVAVDSSGALDTTFNASGTGTTIANGTSYTPPNVMRLRPDGKIVIAGMFTEYNGVSINGMALLNADGSLDTTFNPNNGVSGGSSASNIALSTDGGIFFSGYFTSYNGTTVSGFFKADATGVLDAQYMSNATIMSAYAPNIAVKQSDDKLLIAGNFNVVNGTPKNYLVRLNTDGSIDTGFNIGSGPNGFVQSLYIQPDGKILIAGYFIAFNGTSTPGVARLNPDGTLDNTFTPGTGFSSNGMLASIYAIERLSNGKILLGGSSFTTYDGNTVTNKNVIRLNADGTFDSSFNTSGVGVNNMSLNVYFIKEQADGKILLGGNFTSFNGTNANGFIRLNADGTVDTTFTQAWGAGAGFNAGALLRYIFIQPNDNKIIAVGAFTSYNSTSRTNLVRINTDGTLDTTFNAGTAGTVSTPFLEPSGKLLVPGAFTTFNGTAINKLVRLNTDGTVDTSFSPGTTGASGAFSPTAPSRITHVIPQTDGKLLVMGNFNSYNGTARNLIARLTPVVTNNMATTNLSVPKFTLYPNPAKDFVNLSNITKGADVSVFDMTGKLLYQTKSTGTTFTLNTFSLKNGIYLLKVDGQTTKLLIAK